MREEDLVNALNDIKEFKALIPNGYRFADAALKFPTYKKRLIDHCLNTPSEFERLFESETDVRSILHAFPDHQDLLMERTVVSIEEFTRLFKTNDRFIETATQFPQCAEKMIGYLLASEIMQQRLLANQDDLFKTVDLFPLYAKALFRIAIAKSQDFRRFVRKDAYELTKMANHFPQYSDLLFRCAQADEALFDKITAGASNFLELAKHFKKYTPDLLIYLVDHHAHVCPNSRDLLAVTKKFPEIRESLFEAIMEDPNSFQRLTPRLSHFVDLVEAFPDHTETLIARLDQKEFERLFADPATQVSDLIDAASRIPEFKSKLIKYAFEMDAGSCLASSASQLIILVRHHYPEYGTALCMRNLVILKHFQQVAHYTSDLLQLIEAFPNFEKTLLDHVCGDVNEFKRFFRHDWQLADFGEQFQDYPILQLTLEEAIIQIEKNQENVPAAPVTVINDPVDHFARLFTPAPTGTLRMEQSVQCRFRG